VPISQTYIHVGKDSPQTQTHAFQEDFNSLTMALNDGADLWSACLQTSMSNLRSTLNLLGLGARECERRSTPADAAPSPWYGGDAHSSSASASSLVVSSVSSLMSSLTSSSASSSTLSFLAFFGGPTSGSGDAERLRALAMRGAVAVGAAAGASSSSAATIFSPTRLRPSFLRIF
jgi:hypothetical protein